MSISFNVLRALRLRWGFIALAVTLGLFVPSADASGVTWTVTVNFNVTDTDHPKYTVTKTMPSGSSCSYSAPSHAYILHICTGDTVVWQTVTPSQGAYTLRLFFPVAIFNGPGGGLAKSFDGSNTTLATGTVANSITASDDDEYSYSIGVLDNVTGKLYVHDPKVIIGTGTRLTGAELVNDLQDNSKSLKDLNVSDKVNEDLKKLDDVIKKLRDDLHVH